MMAIFSDLIEKVM
jgi:hypothetical protein